MIDPRTIEPHEFWEDPLSNVEALAAGWVALIYFNPPYALAATTLIAAHFRRITGQPGAGAW